MSLQRSSLLLAGLASLAAAVLAAPAHAVPIYFEGNLGVGFSASDPAVIAEGIDVVVDGSYAFLTAGDPSLSPLLEVTTSLVEQPTVPATPSFATPITATVQYTVTNATGSVLDDEHLVFTWSGDLAAYPALSHDEFGIDVPGLVLIELASCAGNAIGPCVFGAVALPNLAPGASHQFQITHVLADGLSGSTVIPTPSVALLQHASGPVAVPEPAAAMLLLVAVAGILRPRRR